MNTDSKYKKPLFTMLVLVLLNGNLCAQSNNKVNDIRKVIDAQKVVFFGYDYSHFKIIDAQRKGQNIQYFTFVWLDFMLRYLKIEDMEKKFKKDVEFDFDYIAKTNNELKSDRLITDLNNSIDPIEIQEIISNYETAQVSGIGFTIIYECFNNEAKTVSGYYTFFDIESKEVLWMEYVNSYDGNSYNKVIDWSMGMLVAFNKRFIPIYKKYRKQYQ